MEPSQLKVGKSYLVYEKINSGAFGEVFRGINQITSIDVAIKIEPAKSKYPLLQYEYQLYQYFMNDKTVIDKGTPSVYYYKKQEDYNVLVMDLLGPSLEALFTMCRKQLSVKTVLMLADQLLQRISYVHSRYYIHRDIKPDNFLIGIKQNEHKVFIVDFGLAKRYFYKDKHIELKKGKKLTGTARYASINTHQGYEQGRRDDLESLGYMLLYFLRGSLPWQNMQAKDKEDKYEKIKEKKLNTPISTLCKGYPAEFATYLTYCRNLKFEEKPDYTYLRKLFKDLFKRSGYQLDYIYDWNIIAEKQNKKKSTEDKSISNLKTINSKQEEKKQNK